MSKKLGYVFLGIYLIVWGVVMAALGGNASVWVAFDIFSIIVGVILLVSQPGAKSLERAGLTVLGVLFILAILHLLWVSFAYLGVILAILSIVAGVLILLGLPAKGTAKKIGLILLGIWAILLGLTGIVTLGISGLTVILAALAIVAGILILIG